MESVDAVQPIMEKSEILFFILGIFMTIAMGSVFYYFFKKMKNSSSGDL